MSKKLSEIRKKIDRLDDQVHDLLMQRAGLIVDILEEKKKAGAPVVQPAREAMMIRRLLERHAGPLPQAAIIGIWRELVGAICLLQKDLKVQVSAEKGQEYCWDMAKDYFGSVMPMNRVSSAVQAISTVREDDNNMAVVPWPHDGEQQPWWGFLVHQESGAEKKRIVCALPGGSAQSFDQIPNKALVIAKSDFAPSGHDHSFIAIEINRDVSRARIMDVCDEHDLATIGICTKSGPEYEERTIHLVEVDDFVGEADKRLQEIESVFESSNARCISLGGYPVMPVFKSDNANSVEY